MHRTRYSKSQLKDKKLLYRTNTICPTLNHHYTYILSRKVIPENFFSEAETLTKQDPNGPRESGSVSI